METPVKTITQQTTPAEMQIRDVSQTLSMIEPDIYPLDTVLRNLPAGPKATQTKIEWAKVRPHPRVDKLTAENAGGAATATDTITVENGGMWRVDDIIFCPNNADVPPLQVESIATNVLTVRALGLRTAGNPTGHGTVPVIPVDTVIAWIGNAKHEKFGKSDSRAMMPQLDYNMCEATDAVIDISLTRLATKNYTNMQDWPRAQKEQVKEFRKSNEGKAWFGSISETLRTTAAGTTELQWTMNGVTKYISRELTYQKGANIPITENLLVDWFIKTFTGNNGSPSRIFFVDSYLLGELTKVPLISLRSKRSEKVLGIQVERIEIADWVVYLKHTRMFNELGKNHYGVILDLESIYKRNLREMEIQKLMLKETGAADAEGIQLKEQWSIEVQNPDAHAEIIGE